MRQAYVVAQRGSCPRKRVGALIVNQAHRVVASGYNGAPRRQPDCFEVGCDLREIEGKPSCVRTLHAESNAIDFAGRDAEGCTLYTTVVPCRLCALRIIQAGILVVYYHEYYRSQGTDSSLELMLQGGVVLQQLGYPNAVVIGTYADPEAAVGTYADLVRTYASDPEPGR